ncbi:MAG: DNA phosphorothioation-dependent restriction protein DptG [Bacillota bacterium]
MFDKRLDKLKKYLNYDSKFKHNKGKKVNLFPFTTRNPERAKFRKGFDGVTGEFCRLITDKKLEDDYSIKSSIENMLENKNLEFGDVELKNKFKNMLLEYVYPEGDLEILSPQLFSYLPLSEGDESKGEIDIASFIKDVLWKKNDSIKNVLLNSEPDIVLTKFFIENFDLLEDNEKNSKKYDKKLENISDLFMEDFEYLLKDEDYFIDNFDQLLSYYYFYYITQLYLNLKSVSTKKNHEMYYILNWESASKKRKSCECGYTNRIKSGSENLLLWVYALEHLNFLFDEEGKTFYELRKIFEEMSDDDQENLLDTVKAWINAYREKRDLEKKDLKDDYEKLENALIDSLGEAHENPKLSGTQSRYFLPFDEIGKRYFLKSRGPLSYVGNITQDFLLFLTTICVKNERIKIKELFLRYEERGIYFDRYSKHEVKDFLNKINVLDKKSDSGDAQYVKPIL